jgi:Protein of unknown function (DUF3631)
MPKSTPEQLFTKFYYTANDAATPEHVREDAKRRMAAWLKRHGKTERDYPTIFAKAAEDEKAQQPPPPPPPDPRDNTSVRFDPKRHNPASLVESIIRKYVTMSEHVRVIYVLAIILTHVYTRFSIAPRVVLTSKKAACGKSVALEVGRRLAFNPNEEAVGTGAALEDHYSRGPCSLWLDETAHGDAEFNRRTQRVWNIGHKAGPSSKISKMEAGKKRTISLFGLVFLAGTSKGVGRLLAAQQQSRTFWLEMQKYTEETKPAHNFNIEEEVDDEAFRSVYSLLRRWEAKAKLNPKPSMPSGLIARDADNLRGLFAISEDCGGDWPRRLREAVAVLFEQQQAKNLEIVILRHGLAIFEMLDVERVKTTEFDKELHRLDLPGANWRRYCGPGGDELEHLITPTERADLLRESGIETKNMRPVGGGKTFRGLERSWFEAALRERESAAPDDAGPERGRLRLITPALGLSLGLATSPVLVTAFSQVPGSVVGAGLPGLVVVCGAVLALARRRRRQCTPPALDHPQGR